MTVNIPYKKIKPSNLFCILMAWLILLYIFITPSFETPDEPAHFARAYGITECQFILRDHPANVVHFVREKMYRHLEFYRSIGAVLEKNSGRIPNLAFNTALYAPVPYFAHSLVIKLATLTGSNSTTLIIALYLARLVSLFLFVGMLCCTVRLTSSLKWPLLWVASTPMVLAQAGAVSIDVVVFGTSILILVLSLGQIESWRNIWLIIITGMVLMLTKPIYAPILLVPFISLMIKETHQKHRKMALFFIGMGVALIPSLVWNYIIKTNGVLDHYSRVSTLTNPTAQLSQVLEHPLQFLYVICNTFVMSGKLLYHQFVGVLSWLDTPVPVWVTVVWAFSAIASLCVSDSKDIHSMTAGKRYVLGITCIISALLCLLLLLLSAYMIWMKVGADIIILQGRYFHVIFAVFVLGIALCVPPSLLSEDNRNQIKWGLVISAGVINIVSLFTLIKKFWL